MNYVRLSTVRTVQIEGRGKNDAIRWDEVRLVWCDTARPVHIDTYGKCDAAWSATKWLVG